MGPNELAETIDGLSSNKKSFRERNIYAKFITPSVEQAGECLTEFPEVRIVPGTVARQGAESCQK